MIVNSYKKKIAKSNNKQTQLKHTTYLIQPQITLFGCDNTQIQINTNKVNVKLNLILINIQITKKQITNQE